jgi:hypothetical protein
MLSGVLFFTLAPAVGGRNCSDERAAVVEDAAAKAKAFRGSVVGDA